MPQCRSRYDQAAALLSPLRRSFAIDTGEEHWRIEVDFA
jgi:hypothetical protein